MAEPAQLFPKRVDAIVIGAGPAGSTAAAALAKAGRSVLVLERRSHPRFHIGESMLPPIMLILKELGALELMMAQGYVLKYGAEFGGGRRGRHGRIPFSGQGPGRQHVTFQAERAHFDKTLSDFAQECGAIVLQNACVTDLLQEDDQVVGVRYLHAGSIHEVRAPYVVDAGGRGSKISHSFGLRKVIEQQRMVAAFQHFDGLDERHNPGVAGDIQIGEHADGWVWAIPIWSDTISVGSVMPREVLLQADDRQALFDEHVSRISRIAQRLTGTRPISELRVEVESPYYSDRIVGPGWLMAGDAACFVDPIFSGGVFLAMMSGLRAGQAVDQILADPDRADELQQNYSNFYKTGYDTYTRLIFAYYEEHYNLRSFLKSAGFDISGDELGKNKWLARLVSGDFWNQRNALVRQLHQESRWKTFAPFEPAWGCPFYEDLNIAEETTDA